MKLFADTSALLGLVMRDDQYHERAKTFVRKHPQARFVLTDLILVELVTRARVRAGAQTAVALAHSILRSRRYEVLYLDPDLLHGALEQMARYADKRLSLTDCASFEIMGRLGLKSAFAFDEDFRDCGFEMLP